MSFLLLLAVQLRLQQALRNRYPSNELTISGSKDMSKYQRLPRERTIRHWSPTRLGPWTAIRHVTILKDWIFPGSPICNAFHQIGTNGSRSCMSSQHGVPAGLLFTSLYSHPTPPPNVFSGPPHCHNVVHVVRQRLPHNHQHTILQRSNSLYTGRQAKSYQQK